MSLVSSHNLPSHFPISRENTTEMKHLIPVIISFSMSIIPVSIALASSDARFFSVSNPRGDWTFPAPPANVNPRLQRVRGDTDHLVSILMVEIEAIDSKAKEALHMASKLLSNPSTLKPIAFCLETCIDNYNLILESKQRVLDAIGTGDAEQLSAELSSNADNIFTCEDAFKKSDIKSPVMEMDSLLAKMITNSLIIAVDMVYF
ncbi:hypothetical protein V6N13_040696 [Hibiscus sabdariffa]|uniref:Pectinesterase inhibitor domain-containing protein n=1 Tax=Hibiscus sabdariffa TaxID=183260 RepID=A0ABR2R947_9ROSI